MTKERTYQLTDVLWIEQDEYPQFTKTSGANLDFHIENIWEPKAEQSITAISKKNYPIDCEVLDSSSIFRDDEYRLVIPTSLKKYYQDRKFLKDKSILRMHAIIKELNYEYIFVLKRYYTFRLSKLIHPHTLVKGAIANSYWTRKIFFNLIYTIGKMLENRPFYGPTQYYWTKVVPGLVKGFDMDECGEETDIIVEYSRDFSSIVGFAFLEKTDADDWNVSYLGRTYKNWKNDLLESTFKVIATTQPKFYILKGLNSDDRVDRFLQAKGIIKKYHWILNEDGTTYNDNGGEEGASLDIKFYLD